MCIVSGTMKKIFYILILCFTVMGCDKAPEKDAFDLKGALGGAPNAGFKRAIEPREFSFPEDHSSHPDFRNEWWYVTGNLRTDTGRHFGYQVTFFRAALSPKAPENVSAWATNQAWMAHVAITDVENSQHWHDQRLTRGAVGLAGQENKPFRVWLEDWQIVGNDYGEFPWAITVKADDFTLNLQVSPEKSVVLQGDQGLSKKSASPGNASYYYSFTRLKTVGEIYLGGGSSQQRMVVQGESWLDREWSTSVLGDDQSGWDWFSLQLADKHELMFYRLRKTLGEADEHSSGKWVLPDGSIQALNVEDVLLKPKRYWVSEAGRRYPVEWELNVPKLDKSWVVEALVDDQLMETGITYWEGAVRVTDLEGQEVLGYGYLEMSGY